MCIWTAYAGPEPAGEIVYRTLKRTWGIWGGYFTGLVSNDAGKLVVGRTAGDFGVWESRFKPADFRGNAAIFHSRTPSEDDGTWSHPFGTDLVQVAEQGCFGCFHPQIEQNCSALAAELVAAGYEFPSATTRHPEGDWQVRLPDDRTVHSDEVIAFAADRIYKTTHDPFAALRGSFGRAPSEAVVVSVFADRPGKLYIANVNQRAALAHEHGGIVLSTTRMSFDDPAAGDITEIPCNTVAEIGADGVCRFETFLPDLRIERAVPAGFREQAIAWWRGKEKTHISAYWDEFLKNFWPQVPGLPDTRAIMAYRVLDELLMTGKLVAEIVEMPSYFAPEHCSRAVSTWRD